MATIKKNQKLCWNCDGEVDKDAIVCLFCGADLSEQTVAMAPTYKTTAPLHEEEKALPPLSSEAPAAVQTKEESSSFVAMFFLLPGLVFFLFSLLLAFFSSDGTLVLKWNSSIWYVYSIAALPLVYFGYRLL